MQGRKLSDTLSQQRASVHPSPSSTPTSPDSTVGDRFIKRIVAALDNADVGHRNQYSVERALAFREYCARTSVARVFAVCVLTPLPALVASISLDLIPLVDPSRGWRANYTFFIRIYWQSFFISIGGVLIMKPMILPGCFTWKGGIVIAAATAGSFIGFQVLLSNWWGFPLPFCAVLTVTLFVMLFLLFSSIIIGFRKLATSSTLQQQIKNHLQTVAVDGSLVLIYPSFNAIFTWASGVQQTLLICTLPILNFTLKFIFARASPYLEERTATTVVFSVEVFNALYTSVSMQLTTSPVTIPLIFLLDVFQIGIAVRAIYLQTNVAPQPTETINSSKHFLEELSTTLRAAFQETRKSNLELIRVRAPTPFPVSIESQALLEELSSMKCTENYSRHFIQHASNSFLVPKLNQKKLQPESKSIQTNDPRVSAMSTVYPLRDTMPSQRDPSQFTKAKHSSSSKLSKRSCLQEPKQALIVREKLQALFHSEYIALIEYVECVVPLLYAVYLTILVHTPNAVYYPHVQALTPSKLSSTLSTLVLYGLVEIFSLCLVHVLIKRRLGFSPFYQIAFVLENHTEIVQGHLMIWIIHSLGYTLQHLGVDFTFKFKRLHAG